MFGLKTARKRLLAGKICDRLDLRGRRRENFTMDLAAADFEFDLDLERLLTADDFNFFHDVDGITRHLNRETGKMENHFVPRFATNKRRG